MVRTIQLGIETSLQVEPIESTNIQYRQVLSVRLKHNIVSESSYTRPRLQYLRSKFNGKLPSNKRSLCAFCAIQKWWSFSWKHNWAELDIFQLSSFRFQLFQWFSIYFSCMKIMLHLTNQFQPVEPSININWTEEIIPDFRMGGGGAIIKPLHLSRAIYNWNLLKKIKH